MAWVLFVFVGGAVGVVIFTYLYILFKGDVPDVSLEQLQSDLERVRARRQPPTATRKERILLHVTKVKEVFSPGYREEIHAPYDLPPYDISPYGMCPSGYHNPMMADVLIGSGRMVRAPEFDTRETWFLSAEFPKKEFMVNSCLVPKLKAGDEVLMDVSFNEDGSIHSYRVVSKG